MIETLLYNVLHYLGGGVCHQFPERSLWVSGRVQPLCARCTGTYLGAVIGLLVVVVRGRWRASLLPTWRVLAVLGVFVAVWGLDGLNSYLTFFPGVPHLYEPSNTLRLLTGSLEGLALILVIWPVVAMTLLGQPEEVPIARGAELALGVVGVVAVAGAVSLGVPGVVYLAGVVSVVGLVALFALLNALLLAVVLRRERWIGRGRGAVWCLLAATLLGGAELVFFSVLRHWLLGF